MIKTKYLSTEIHVGVKGAVASGGVWHRRRSHASFESARGVWRKRRWVVGELELRPGTNCRLCVAGNIREAIGEPMARTNSGASPTPVADPAGPNPSHSGFLDGRPSL